MKIVKRWLQVLACATLALPAASQQKEIQYLSGTDSKHTVAWDFFCTSGRKSGAWTKIEVPAHWEQQGFGAYNYGRDYKTYGKNFRFADEQGLYKHQFTIPASWKGKQVFIVFEGSMTDTEVKINGKPAGEIHQGAFYRFKYNITDKVVLGKTNTLEVTVSKMSADQSVNNAERLADYWVFGGIFRPVYLEAVPENL
jgi:beta-galactosidase/beta-glucuronidase